MTNYTTPAYQFKDIYLGNVFYNIGMGIGWWFEDAVMHRLHPTGQHPVRAGDGICFTLSNVILSIQNNSFVVNRLISGIVQKSSETLGDETMAIQSQYRISSGLNEVVLCRF
jgi:hypothetical protein